MPLTHLSVCLGMFPCALVSVGAFSWRSSHCGRLVVAVYFMQSLWAFGVQRGFVYHSGPSLRTSAFLLIMLLWLMNLFLLIMERVIKYSFSLGIFMHFNLAQQQKPSLLPPMMITFRVQGDIFCIFLRDICSNLNWLLPVWYCVVGHQFERHSTGFLWGDVVKVYNPTYSDIAVHSCLHFKWCYYAKRTSCCRCQSIQLISLRSQSVMESQRLYVNRMVNGCWYWYLIVEAEDKCMFLMK